MFFFNVSKHLVLTEAVAQTCSVKKVFLEISQKSQENTFFHRAPLVAASVLTKTEVLKTCRKSKFLLKKI